MSVSKGSDRRREFESLEDAVVKDYDPENDQPSTDDASEPEETEDHGRQRYEIVGKSKLRRPKDTSLGLQYRGSKVSRDDMMLDDEDDEDDPFAKDFDVEDSEEVEDESEDDEDEDVGEFSGEDDASDNAEEEETDDTEMSDVGQEAAAVDRAELRRAMASQRSAVAATISAAAKADAEKGRAVIRQRATFDALLNARIKLQKSLIATNSLVALEADDLEGLRSSQDDAIHKAEDAALALWTSLSQFRQRLDTANTQKPLKSTASTQDMFQRLKLQDELVRAQRNAVLQKWSLKSRGVTAAPQQGRLNNEQPATIVDVLNEHLASSDRLLKRARTPRSCAPAQLSKRIEEDEHIYDDADFYGLLLKELLEAKSSAASAAATNVDLSHLASMRRDAKTRKSIDTKASKGRKMKYTVHEKLQNYCAPEDRTTWGDRQVEELFSSLFGQKADLAEDKANDSDAEMHADEALMLFRS